MHAWQRWCIDWITFWILRCGKFFQSVWISIWDSRATHTGDGTLFRTWQSNTSETCSMADIISHGWPFHYIYPICLQKCFTTCMSGCIVMLRRPPIGRCLRRCLHMEGTSKCLKMSSLYRAALTFHLSLYYTVPCMFTTASRTVSFHNTVVLLYWNLSLDNWAATWQNQQSDYVPREDSDQPGHPPSLIRVFAVRTKKARTFSYPLSAQRRLWSDWADAHAQSDQSLRWAHSHFVGFVMSRLN